MPDTRDVATNRRPPSIDALLRDDRLRDAIAEHGATSATTALRAVLDEAREAWRRGADIEPAAIIDAAVARLQARREVRSRRVFNCTGTTLHTNLGRAPLAESAIDAAVRAMRHPLTLEYDLVSGGRGDRDDLVESLIRELTGAEAATVVNNNAAAVLLALDTLGGLGTVSRNTRKEVIVSRGELIEIGGAFRVPDIMRRAGCRLVEVGTTNRTHVADYEEALTPKTALVMKAHASNYRIEGFVAQPAEREIAAVAHAASVPFLVDLGAGALIDLAAYGLPHEPTVAETIAAGADLVTFSADKLLGGPQAGIVAGRRDLIARLKKNPLKRCLRCDKATLAALEATLLLYREPEHLVDRLTTLRWLTRPREAIAAVAARLHPAFAATLAGYADVTVEDCLSQIGSGAQPVDLLPSAALVIRPTARPPTVRGGRVLLAIEAGLRALPIPIIGRVAKGALWLDCRTVENADELLASWSCFRMPTAITPA
jgi:L-seryl-tRNA(Ser) seleniumtransferase